LLSGTAQCHRDVAAAGYGRSVGLLVTDCLCEPELLPSGPTGAFLGGWLATTHDIRTPLYAAAVLLLSMTAVTASMTNNRRVEAALRATDPAGGPDHPASKDPAQKSAPEVL
jgi:hypothetical protein